MRPSAVNPEFGIRIDAFQEPLPPAFDGKSYALDFHDVRADVVLHDDILSLF
jgi:hypothetical protein